MEYVTFVVWGKITWENSRTRELTQGSRFLTKHIQHMGVPLQPIFRGGNWWYFTRSWREATCCCAIILTNIDELEMTRWKVI